MTFQPILPVGGFAGWRVLQATLPTQKAAFEASPLRLRDTEHFQENIAKVQTPQDLVEDRQLLSVALGAFGLDEDLDNRAFIERILSDGFSSNDALANRLADKRYLNLVEAFGFGEGLPPRTGLSSFPDEILASFAERQFEIAVGDQDSDMRLALGAKREMAVLAAGESVSSDAQWFSVLGSPPLRAVFEKALNLSSAIATVDIDRQLEIFRDASSKIFGTTEISDFGDEELQEDVIRRFLVRSQIDSGPSATTRGATALALLSGAVQTF